MNILTGSNTSYDTWNSSNNVKWNNRIKLCEVTLIYIIILVLSPLFFCVISNTSLGPMFFCSKYDSK